MKYRMLLILTLLLCAEAFGSWFRAVTFREMVEWTDAWVRAEVIQKKAVRVHVNFTAEETGTHYDYETIYTRYRLKVSDVLYGDDPGTFVDLHLPGGTIGNKGYVDSSAYNLEDGWEIVVALEWDPNRDIFVSAGSGHTVFRAREINGETLWVILSDYADYSELDPETAVQPREHLTLDDWLRPQHADPVLTYDTLKALLEEVE